MILRRSKQESLAVFLEDQNERGNLLPFYGGSGYPSTGKCPFVSAEERDEQALRMTGLHSVPSATSSSSWMGKVAGAVRESCNFFFRSQDPEGFWWAELESNVTITSEYIMLLFLLECIDTRKLKGMVKYILNHQQPNGSWGLYYGDPGNLSITIEAYFALKLVGEDPESAPLRKAREFILRNGGVEAARVFTKIWLALFSQYDWDKVPSMPVELVLIPSHAYFSIYEFSSWARGTIVPLSIVMAIRPRFTLPSEKAIPELYVQGGAGASRAFVSYTHSLFYLIDRMVKRFERRPLPSLRNRAIQTAENWVLDHQEESGDWGGIQPPMVYSMLALHYMGYTLDHPVMARGLKALEDFCIDDDEGVRMQSCVSPVWDTALACLGLLDAGVPPDHPVLKKATAWLVQKQVLSGGDWQVKNCCPPGGWAFEFVNNQYPDVDDSAVVLVALARLTSGPDGALEFAKRRGMEWSLSMQSSSGGWAAFDRDNTMTILNRIPFADQEAMVDYPSADVTGRMLEAMGHYGYARDHHRAVEGLRFLHDLQEPDGSWWGRWGVNYIYGTWSVLRGLAAIGEDMKAPYVQSALRWLKDHQNPDGGWGETCESYKSPDLRGQGTSTASQTAWALMGLMVGGEAECPEVRRGIEYLVKTQQDDGTWEEQYFTGTGFPNHFYIRYHYYRNYFPLMALGQYLKRLKEKVVTG